MSAPTRQPPQLCCPMPHSIQALDLSTNTPKQTLASLRYLLLSYLAILEVKLSKVESPDFELWSETTVEDARAWAQTAMEMLDSIRSDVCSHLPDLPFSEGSLDNFLKTHLPDFEDLVVDLPSLDVMRSSLPDMPFGLSDVRSTFDDVRSRFSDMQPSDYIASLPDRLRSLHSHLSTIELPSTMALSPSTVFVDLIDSVLSSDIVQELFSQPAIDDDDEGSIAGSDVLETVEKMAKDVANALKRSYEGVKLIHHVDIPEVWKSNPFVVCGYRFIPIERWPLLVMSLFAFHNETLNIHTHLLPFVLWLVNLIPFLNSSASLLDAPERAFMAFALLCLFCSAVWHTMAGCSHQASMEFCARADYVGIGWLISASVGTVVHYGYQCHASLGKYFLYFCLVMGIAGNVFPFMKWFNQYKYRHWRIFFFVSLALSAVAPLTGLAILHSTKDMFAFIGPVIPSLISYIIGLVFYATHVPERFLSEKWRTRLDAIGGGSHAIWHCFIVLAVSQHRAAIGSLKQGMTCAV